MAFNPYSLENKTILITGASSGIGKATAIACSKMGAKVVITGRNAERLQETFQKLEGDGHQQIIAELTNEDDLKRLVEEVPLLDGLVNNAGIGSKTPINFIKQSALQNILDVNTIAPIMLTKMLLKKKKLQKGSSVVLTSSISGVCSVDIGNTLYSVSKSAIDGFMKNAAKELAEKGIRVNSVNPGMVDTPINDYSNVGEEQMQADLLRYPLKRHGKPIEIAYAIIYLLSDAAAWITGTALKIDGGYSL
jgi:NAD(P)-dependent dehydrogenase (short-subunit alcohol dehydrogenase family)